MNEIRKSEFFSNEMRNRSELFVRYVIEDVYRLPFDLNDVYSWIVEYGTLYVKRKETDGEYIEYGPSFNFLNDHPNPFHYPDLTLIKSYKNDPVNIYRG
jgi:hypothetical protein